MWLLMRATTSARPGRVGPGPRQARSRGPDAEVNRSRTGIRPISAKGAPGKRRGGRLVVRTVGPGRRRLRQRQQGHTIDNTDALQCLSVRKRWLELNKIGV